MKKLILLLLLSSLISGCSDYRDGKEIESQFKVIKDHAKAMNNAEIINMMDKDSKEYFEALIDLVEEKSEAKLSELGKKNNAYLSTKLLYQFMQGSDTIKRAKKVALNEIVFFAQFVGLGILNPSDLDRMSFKEVDEIKGKTATVSLRNKANNQDNTYIVTQCRFTKEEEVWKINIPSTFRFGEKLLKMKWRQTGGDVDTFLQNHITSSSKEEKIKFRYRK